MGLYKVYGRIFTATGVSYRELGEPDPETGIRPPSTVVAFHDSLVGDVQLGEPAEVDNEGGFEILYDPEGPLFSIGRQWADTCIELRDPKGNFVARSETCYRSGKVEEIVLTLAGGSPAQVLQSTISASAGPLNVGDLSDEQVLKFAASSGLERGLINYLRTSGRTVGADPARMGLHLSLSLTGGGSPLQRLSVSGGALEGIANELTERGMPVSKATLVDEREAYFLDYLSGTDVSAEEMTFLREMTGGGGPGQRFPFANYGETVAFLVEYLDEVIDISLPAGQRKEAESFWAGHPDVHLAAQLRDITRSNYGLVRAILDAVGPGSSLYDVALLDEATFSQVLALHPGGSLAGVSNETYREVVDRIVWELEPAGRFVRSLQAGEGSGPILGTDADVTTLLGLPGIERFETANVVALVPQVALRKRAAQIQSLMRVARYFDAAQALADAGLTSAKLVAQEDPRRFVERFRQVFKSAHLANEAHLRAQWLAGAVDLVQSKEMGRAPLSALQRSTEHEPTEASWGTYFGSPDAIAVEHDDSVLGAPAYLFSLLKFLADIDRSDGAEGSAFDLLTARRPDIVNIPLSHEEAKNRLPVVDLVNELLEKQVTGADPVETEDPEPGYPRWLQPLAYAELASFKRWPFELWSEEIRSYLEAAGVDLEAVVAERLPTEDGARFWAPSRTRADSRWIQAFLGGGKALELAFEDSSDILAALGVASVSELNGPVVANAQPAGVLAVCGLELSELDRLAEVLAARHVVQGASARSLFIVAEGAGSLEDVSTSGIDEAKARGLYRIHHLSRVTGLSPLQVDEVIAGLGGYSTLTFAQALYVAERLEMSPPDAVQLWRAVPDDDSRTPWGRDEPYRAFLLRRFAPRTGLSSTVIEASEKLVGKVSQLANGLDVGSGTVDAVIGYRGLRDADATAENVQTVIRDVLLVRSLDLSVADLQACEQLLGSPYTDPATTLDFVEFVRRAQAFLRSGPADLVYALGGTSQLDELPSDEALGEIVDAKDAALKGEQGRSPSEVVLDVVASAFDLDPKLAGALFGTGTSLAELSTVSGNGAVSSQVHVLRRMHRLAHLVSSLRLDANEVDALDLGEGGAWSAPEPVPAVLDARDFQYIWDARDIAEGRSWVDRRSGFEVPWNGLATASLGPSSHGDDISSHAIGPILAGAPPLARPVSVSGEGQAIWKTSPEGDTTLELPQGASMWVRMVARHSSPSINDPKSHTWFELWDQQFDTAHEIVRLSQYNSAGGRGGGVFSIFPSSPQPEGVYVSGAPDTRGEWCIHDAYFDGRTGTMHYAVNGKYGSAALSVPMPAVEKPVVSLCFLPRIDVAGFALAIGDAANQWNVDLHRSDVAALGTAHAEAPRAQHFWGVTDYLRLREDAPNLARSVADSLGTSRRVRIRSKVARTCREVPSLPPLLLPPGDRSARVLLWTVGSGSSTVSAVSLAGRPLTRVAGTSADLSAWMLEGPFDLAGPEAPVFTSSSSSGDEFVVSALVMTGVTEVSVPTGGTGTYAGAEPGDLVVYGQWGARDSIEEPSAPVRYAHVNTEGGALGLFGHHTLGSSFGARSATVSGAETREVLLVRGESSLSDLADGLGERAGLPSSSVQQALEHLGDVPVPTLAAAFVGACRYFVDQDVLSAPVRIDIQGTSSDVAWTQEVAARVRHGVRASMGATVFEGRSGAIRGRLRELQQAALVRYLLAHPGAEQWKDETDLFGHFLIDVKMTSAVTTSRLIQASASVQLLLQRASLGYEPLRMEEVRRKWEWFRRYRVWEANQRIFLFTENYLLPEIRRQKTQTFSTFEDRLLEGPLDAKAARAAFEGYLDELKGISNLSPVSLYRLTRKRGEKTESPAEDSLVVVAREGGADGPLYMNTWKNAAFWSGWRKVDIDIPSDHLFPVFLLGDLYLFWFTWSEAAPHPAGLELPSGPDAPTAAERESRRPPRTILATLNYTIQRAGKWLRPRATQEALRWEVNNQRPTADIARARRFVVNAEDAVATFQPIGERSTMVFDALEQSASITQMDPIIDDGEYSTRYQRQETHWVRLGLGGDSMPSTERLNSLSDRSRLMSVLVPSSSAHAYASESPWGVVKLYHRSFVVERRLASDAPEQRRLPRLGHDYTSWERYSDLDAESTYFSVNRTRGGDRGLSPVVSRAFRENMLEAQVAATTRCRRVEDEDVSSFNGNESSRPATSGAHRYRFRPMFMGEGDALKGIWKTGSLEAFFSPETQTGDASTGNYDFATEFGPNWLVDSDYPKSSISFDFDDAYGVYGWEVFYHAPIRIASAFLADEQFELAREWVHAVFDPTKAQRDSGEVWRFQPFRNWVANSGSELALLINGAEDDTTRALRERLEREIEAWKEHPFDPHAIGSVRVEAYMRWTVFLYLDILIGWGDKLFREDTFESVNEAMQLYLLAQSILGREPVLLPDTERNPKSFAEMTDASLVTDEELMLESLLGFRATITLEAENRDDEPHLPLDFGVPRSSFRVPPNDKLTGYWALVQDRLFKIRSSQNIQGVERTLALTAPPIDPLLIAKALASGLPLSKAVAAGSSSERTPYRFRTMLQQALELVGATQGLGGLLLSALEKQDSERLAQLTSEHRGALLEAQVKQREDGLKEAQAQLQGLRDSRANVEARRAYYASRVELNVREKAQMSLLESASDQNKAAQDQAAVTTVIAALPDISLGAQGWASTPAGMLSVKQAITMPLELRRLALTSGASADSDRASRAGIRAGHQRRHEDSQFQAAQAARELTQMDAQIAAAELRVAMAEHEIGLHDQQMRQQEIEEEVLKSKFTEKELYGWMVRQVQSLYSSMYQLAHRAAKRAEASYRFELARPGDSFIQPSYWDSLRKGLLAGEQLAHDLRRMQAAHTEKNVRELEMVKHVSLAALKPEALLTLRESGSAQFTLDEALFDRDYPGHYLRRIRSVAVTIPAVTGPYEGVQCQLTMTGHGLRTDPLLVGEHAAVEPDGGVVSEAIVTSTGQNDAMVGESGDDRYMPFEGYGAVSRWTLSLPQDDNRFDITSVSDVVLHIRYTARQGSSALAEGARQAAWPKNGTKRTGATLMSLRADFPSAWAAISEGRPGSMDLSASLLRVPLVYGPVAVDQLTFALPAVGGFAGTVTVGGPPGTSGSFAATQEGTMVQASLDGPFELGSHPLSFTAWDASIEDVFILASYSEA